MSTQRRPLFPLATGGGGFAKAAQPFACGGFAACFASTIIHPIDLAKVRLQLFSVANPGVPTPSFPTLIANMIKEGGVGSIYAGLDASLMRQAIYGTARIGLHRTFSDMIADATGGNVPFWLKTLSGMASGSIAVCIGTPMDVALVRMQADSMKPKAEQRNYAHVLDAMGRTAKEEGFGALYKGLIPNIGRGMAMNVGMLACYDQAKEFSQSIFQDPDPKAPSLPTKLTSACIAGFCAAFFSLPFDMLKSRLQDMKPGADGKMPYAGMTDCAVKIVKAEGPVALWTGFSAYYMRCAPHAMIILMTIEQVNIIYKQMFLS